MQIARVFFDTHMGKNFPGLLSICHKHGVKPEAVAESYVVFINSKRTKFKMLVGNQYLVYHDNKDKQIPLDAIRFLPHAFTGRQFTFTRAVDKMLLEKFPGLAHHQKTNHTHRPQATA